MDELILDPKLYFRVEGGWWFLYTGDARLPANVTHYPDGSMSYRPADAEHPHSRASDPSDN